MRKPSTAKAPPESPDDAPVRPADIAAGKLLMRQRDESDALLRRKQSINIFLNVAVVENFKSRAGERGYQTPINEALKKAIQAETIEAVVRRTIREELRRA